MDIQTSRFGKIEIADDTVIDFPNGLYGLQQLHRYCLLQHDDTGEFFWLQSVEEPSIAMVVTDPFRYFPSYEVEIPDGAAEALETQSVEDVAIYTSVCVTQKPAGAFTNLLGPLVINHRTRVGMQLVLDGSRYTCRHPLAEPEMMAKAA